MVLVGRVSGGCAAATVAAGLLFAPPAAAVPFCSTDDCSSLVSLGFSFPFCGMSWTQVYLSSNGQILFGSPNDDWSPTEGEFLQAPPRIGIPWNDTNQLYGGTERYYLYPDHLEIEFTNVLNYWTLGANTYRVNLWDTGAFDITVDSISYGNAQQNQIVLGYACGGSSSGAFGTDLSATPQPIENNSFDAVYEVFSGGAFDLLGQTLEFCGTSPTGCDFDQDDDGYTEDDGDCDDADATIHPGAQEACDGIDNDCNSLIDDDPVYSWD
ncbi:MAG: hypothetical protein CL928_04985, partial [Deltaproteobacteria bacterium]|nr:hypothetical protein [Deltaproteobacteria bacterium]